MSRSVTRLAALVAVLYACDAAPTAPPAVVGVSVSPAATTLLVGQTQQLSAFTLGGDGTALLGRTITWSSSDVAVASVTTLGLVMAATAGSATITATSEGKNGTASIVVLVPVATVIIAPTPDTVMVGNTVQLAATPKDASGSTLTGRVVLWSTSDTTKARVSAAGLVTAVAVGSATITATSEGKSGTASIVVLVPVGSVSVSPDTVPLIVGATQQLAALTRDAAGGALFGRHVIWSSSDSTKVLVSPTGVVTAIAVGIATVTATSEGKSGDAATSVVPPPTPGYDPWPYQVADMLAKLPLPDGILLTHRSDVSGSFDYPPPKILYGPLGNPNGEISTLAHELGHAHQYWTIRNEPVGQSLHALWRKTQEGMEYLAAGGWVLDSLSVGCTDQNKERLSACWTQDISFCEFDLCHSVTPSGGPYANPIEENAQFIAQWYNPGRLAGFSTWGREAINANVPRRAAWARKWLP